MGKRGPKPTPIAVLETRGSRRAKDRKAAPRPEACVLECPAWVSESALEYWPEIAEQLNQEGISTALDAEVMGLLVDALAEYVEARRESELRGPVETTSNGNVIQSPWVSIMHNAADRTLKLLRELGKTPSARSGLEIGGKAGEIVDPGEAFFRSKGRSR